MSDWQDVRIEGGCYCGRVRYVSDDRPFHETVCHCPDCRRVVGAPAVAWFSVPAASLRFTAAEPARFRSSAAVERSFCATCGTSLTYQHDARPDEIDITTASLDAADLLPPRDHTLTRHKLSWDLICDGLPDFPDGRPPGRPDHAG